MSMKGTSYYINEDFSKETLALRNGSSQRFMEASKNSSRQR